MDEIDLKFKALEVIENRPIGLGTQIVFGDLDLNSDSLVKRRFSLSNDRLELFRIGYRIEDLEFESENFRDFPSVGAKQRKTLKE